MNIVKITIEYFLELADNSAEIKEETNLTKKNSSSIIKHNCALNNKIVILR